MKTKIYVGMMASVLFLTAFSTFAGTRHGGGGMGILCGDRLRTLDLWEAEEVRGLTAGPEFSTLEENQAFYHLRLVQYFRQGAPNPELEEKLAQALVESSFRVLGVRQIEKGTDDLPRSEDADLYEVPPGCVVVQVAYMNDLTGVLKLNSTYFDRLSYRDQTALILHEIIYKLPAGVSTVFEKPNLIVISGSDKVAVGQVAAEIISFRKPEPYKGKGIKIAGKAILRKEGKKK
jgi:hypothetical protein